MARPISGRTVQDRPATTIFSNGRLHDQAGAAKNIPSSRPVVHLQGLMVRGPKVLIEAFVLGRDTTLLRRVNHTNDYMLLAFVPPTTPYGQFLGLR